MVFVIMTIKGDLRLMDNSSIRRNREVNFRLGLIDRSVFPFRPGQHSDCRSLESFFSVRGSVSNLCSAVNCEAAPKVTHSTRRNINGDKL